MALRDDLKIWIKKIIVKSFTRDIGYVVDAAEWNELWTLAVEQGNWNAQMLTDLRDMLYATVLSDTDGAVNVYLDRVGITADNVSDALVELLTTINNNLNSVTVTTNDLQDQIDVNDLARQNQITTTAAGLQNQINADVTALLNHKVSNDHDGRYYTEEEVDAFLADVQADAVADALALATHKTSMDHDGRYYTEEEVDAIEANLQNQLNADIATIVAHKLSGDHDGRYYTEAEIDALINSLQGQDSTHSAAITALTAQIAALDTMYSTDSERAEAIANTIAAFELADDDLEALINNKANISETYTRDQIDGMTLGSYKFAHYKDSGVVVGAQSTIVVDVEQWVPGQDLILGFINGELVNEDVDYTVDGPNRSLVKMSSDWADGTAYTIIVFKNVRVVVAEDVLDGSFLLANTVRDSSLSDSANDVKARLAQAIIDLAGKVDKVAGKGLSEEDFTSTLLTKLNGIAAGANAYTHPATHSASMIDTDATARFINDTLLAKLDGIETGATADQTAVEILALLLTVDTNTSGLNSQYLQGLSPSETSLTKTIVERTAAGDIYGRVLNSSYATTNSDVDFLMTKKSTSNSLRPTTPTQLIDALNLFTEGNYGNIIYSTSSITLGTTHNNSVLITGNTSAITLTVPTTYEPGTQITIIRGNTGGVTIAPASGMTIRSVDSKRDIKDAYGSVTLVFYTSTIAYLIGSLE